MDRSELNCGFATAAPICSIQYEGVTVMCLPGLIYCASPDISHLGIVTAHQSCPDMAPPQPSPHPPSRLPDRTPHHSKDPPHPTAQMEKSTKPCISETTGHTISNEAVLRMNFRSCLDSTRGCQRAFGDQVARA